MKFSLTGLAVNRNFLSRNIKQHAFQAVWCGLNNRNLILPGFYLVLRLKRDVRVHQNHFPVIVDMLLFHNISNDILG